MKTLVIIIFLVCVSSADAMPSFPEVKDSYRKSDALLLDRHGKVIHELRVDPKGRRLEWTGIRDISPALIRAVVLSEDRRFYEHGGVDWKAVGSAAVKNIFSRSSRGASTISMQLASLIDTGLQPKGSKKTLSQKWDQMKAARELEGRWKKDEILEAYMNLVTFRGELQGIAAASRGLFDKKPSGLNELESLILASLIRSPNASVDAVSKRACSLAHSAPFQLACDEIKVLAERTLSGAYSVRQLVTLAPHAAYTLLAITEGSRVPRPASLNKKGTGGIVISTLDSKLQRFVSESLKHQLAAVRSQNVNDGAVLVVENSSGEVLAYVGGTDESKARYVDGVRARRQAGSTLKPFLYALAFEKRLLTPASLIQDSPLEVPTASGIYKPENYENDFKGMVSARTALASSLNVPAVRTLFLVGVDALVQKLEQLGFRQLERVEYYGPSLALGAADVSLWELTNAYRTLANNGVWSEISLVPQKARSQRRRLFSERVAFLVSDILSDREARSMTFSLENPLSTTYWSAVKTGTSKDMRDNWCIGYSRDYTVGVWVGNFTGQSMWNVSGVTGAAPVWLEIMTYLHRDHAGSPPVRPSGITARKVEFASAAEAARNEWFIQGTEPPFVSTGGDSPPPGAAHPKPRITYPSGEMVLTLDPDIPEEYQRLFFEAETGGRDFDWML
ncbi:MAG TPA: penicillin-binding protein 1C, partial [Thermodesulfovibrionales bacterium]|nr:penicillin-binding protein 1C [Thermodesulfovibrionales bacterium]